MGQGCWADGTCQGDVLYTFFRNESMPRKEIGENIHVPTLTTVLYARSVMLYPMSHDYTYEWMILVVLQRIMDIC